MPEDQPNNCRLGDEVDGADTPISAEPGKLDTELELRRLRTEIEALRADVSALTHAVARPERQSFGLAQLARTRRALFRRTVAINSARSRWLERGTTRTEWQPPHARTWAIAALVLISLVALALRAVDLNDTPPGLHGDEAATGLEAQRIIDEGSIGVYTGVAGGNPTGAYYLATIPIRLIDDPIVAVRALSAVAGTLAVGVLFLLALRNFGLATAILAATILTFLEWHLAFSRTAFVTGTWPTVVLVGTFAVMEAIRTRSSWWWVVAGGLLASGTYIYNGNGPVLLIFGAFAVWTLFGWRALAIAASTALLVFDPSYVSILLFAASLLLLAGRRLRERRAWWNLVFFTAGALIVLRPLIDFVRHHRQDYFGRGEQLSVFKTEIWRSQNSIWDKLTFLVDRYRDFWTRLGFDPLPDHVDLTGITPPVPELTLIICLAGGAVALVRRPNALVVLSLAVVALAPLTAVLTDLTIRRTLVMAPFLALLGAVGAVELVRLSFQRRGRVGAALAIALLVGLLVRSSYSNYTDLFQTTVNSESIRHTFAVDLRDTAEYLETLPDDAYVYFYSERWVLEYDVVRYLAPNLRGENRVPKWGGDGSLTMSEANGRPVFVLLGNQMEHLTALQQLYPGGETVTGPEYEAPINGPAFIAYLPRLPLTAHQSD